MKNTINKIVVLYFCIFIISCNDKDDKVLNETICLTEELGITPLNKYSYPVYQAINGVEVIDQENSIKWEWKIYNDTIEITGYRPLGNGTLELHNFFKKNKCIEYLSSRKVFLDDNSSPQNPEYGFQEIIYPSFGLQEYNENSKLVSKAWNDNFDGFTFWVEFNSENHHPEPYDYEQYYTP